MVLSLRPMNRLSQHPFSTQCPATAGIEREKLPVGARRDKPCFNLTSLFVKRAEKQQGFTLLEVLIALAILALALTSLYLVVGRALKASLHARMLSQATLLARQKMAELDYVLLTRGFTDSGLDETKEGRFFEGTSIDNETYPKASNPPFENDQSLQQAFAAYRWKYKVERIAIPDLRPLAGRLGAMTGFSLDDNTLAFLQSLWDQRIRRVTLQVLWKETGSFSDQQVELVRIYADTNPQTVLSVPTGGSSLSSGSTGK